MREILFRGKLANRSKWVEGFFVLLQLANYDRREPLITNKDTGTSYEVDPSTVGQYTGLKDKNGKRIFEGDVVRGTDRGGRFPEVSGYVGHRDGSFVIFGDFMTHYRWLDYDVEVIGNIHDNPELLGGGEDG